MGQEFGNILSLLGAVGLWYFGATLKSGAFITAKASVAAGPAAPGAAVSALAVVIGELIQVWSVTVATAAVANAMYSQFNSQNSASSSSGSGNSSGDNKGTGSSSESLGEPTEKKANLWNKGKLKEHFDNHGAEFGSKSAPEYSDMAYEFGTSNSDSIIQVKEGAFIYRYEPSINTVFVGTDAGGKIKTFYKWDGRADDVVINTLKGLGLIP